MIGLIIGVVFVYTVLGVVCGVIYDESHSEHIDGLTLASVMFFWPLFLSVKIAALALNAIAFLMIAPFIAIGAALGLD